MKHPVLFALFPTTRAVQVTTNNLCCIVSREKGRCATMATPTKKLHLPRCSWMAAPSVQAAEAIVESPSPKPQERLPINVLTGISFTSASKLISLSSMAAKACCTAVLYRDRIVKLLTHHVVRGDFWVPTNGSPPCWWWGYQSVICIYDWLEMGRHFSPSLI